MRKALLIVLSLSILILSLAACASDKPNIIINNNSGQNDPNNENVAFSSEGIVFTESQYLALYRLQKNNFLSLNQYYEAMGYVITDNGAAVADTEEFWNANTGVKDANGKDQSFKDYFNELVFEAFKAYVAKLIIAKQHNITFDDDFYSDLNAVIANDILANSLVDEDTAILDDNGNIPSWIMNRWEMHLASQGIDKETWIEFNYKMLEIDGYLIDKLSSAGVIEGVSAEKAKEEIASQIDDEIKAFLKDNAKFKYIAYEYRTKEYYENEDETSEDSSADTENDNLTAEEKANKYNEELDKKCEDIFNTLKADPSGFDAEIDKCDKADYIKPYKDGMVIDLENYKEFFEEDYGDKKVGDIVMIKNEKGIHILMIVELKEADSMISREVSEEDIQKHIAASIEDDYFDNVKNKTELFEINETVVSKYTVPYKVK